MTKPKKQPQSIKNTKLAGKYTIWGAIIGAVITGIFALFAAVIQGGQQTPSIEQTSYPSSILAFHVVSQTKNELVIDVDYSYDPIWGERIYIGACLYQNGEKIGVIPFEYGGYCGYYPADGQFGPNQVPSVGQGTARVLLRPFINKPEESDEIEIFLNRHGYGETMIVSRRFPFIQNWEP